MNRPPDRIAPHRHDFYPENPTDCPGTLEPVTDRCRRIATTAAGDTVTAAACPVCGRLCSIEPAILPADWPEEA